MNQNKPNQPSAVKAMTVLMVASNSAPDPSPSGDDNKDRMLRRVWVTYACPQDMPSYPDLASEAEPSAA